MNIRDKMAELGARTRLRELLAEVKEIASEFKAIFHEVVAEVQLPNRTAHDVIDVKFSSSRSPVAPTKSEKKRAGKKTAKKVVKAKRTRKCSKCGSKDHDLRTCPRKASSSPAPAPTKGRKRRPMTDAEKAVLSDRMKKYWAACH